MKKLYVAHWGGRTWKERGWWLLWVSPVPVTLILTLLPLAFDEDRIAYITLFVWSSVAVTSATFADIMRRRAKRALRSASKRFEVGDPARELASLNYAVATSIEIVHGLFLAVGISTLILPEDWGLRKLFSRDGIMLGQYILMLVVLRTYYIDQTLRKMLKNNKT